MAAARSVYVEVAGSEQGTLKIALRKDVPARKVWATLEKSRRVSAATHVLETREGSALGPEDPVLASTPGEGDVLLVVREQAPTVTVVLPPPRARKEPTPRQTKQLASSGSGLARGFLGGAAKAKVVAVPIVARLEDLMPPCAESGIFDEALVRDVCRQEAELLRAEIESGRGDAVAFELVEYRRGREAALSQAARQHARLLDSHGVRTVGASPPRLEEVTAMRSLHELMRGMRAKLGERGDLNPGRDKKTELDLCSRVFSLAMNTLLATSRAGRAHDYNMADPSKFLGDGARLLRRPEGSAGAVAYALETAGYIVIDGAADRAAVNGIKRDLERQVATKEFQRPAEQRVTGTRGDSFCWVHDDDANRHGKAALAQAIRSLKGVAAALNDEAENADYKVDEAAMTSRYPPAAEALEATPYRGYRRHQDNHRDTKHRTYSNARAVTAILYANPLGRKQNIQQDFNFLTIEHVRHERFTLRNELDERKRLVQKRAKSTSI